MSPAGRPPDPTRRTETLQRATDYVLEHGLSGLSLRPLAAALGTSTRMLLYDFGTKQQLISAVLAEARRRQAVLLASYRSSTSEDLPQLLPVIWEWLTAPEYQPYLRLFFEVTLDAIQHPDLYPQGGRAMVEDWLHVLDHQPTVGKTHLALPTLLVATLRGLLLDRLTTNDSSRTDQALSTFTALINPDARSQT
jgi:AcrR family transcriptional regulator